jgi:hypothetical protein
LDKRVVSPTTPFNVTVALCVCDQTKGVRIRIRAKRRVFLLLIIVSSLEEVSTRDSFLIFAMDVVYT